jgi:cytochrome P450
MARSLARAVGQNGPSDVQCELAQSPVNEASWLANRIHNQFGYGSRTCLGKNISLLEIAKLVPQLIRHFEVGTFTD